MAENGDSDPESKQGASYMRVDLSDQDGDPLEELLDAHPGATIEVYGDAVLTALEDFEYVSTEALDRLLTNIEPVEIIHLGIIDLDKIPSNTLDYSIDHEINPADIDRVIEISKALRVIRENDELLIQEHPVHDERR